MQIYDQHRSRGVTRWTAPFAASKVTAIIGFGLEKGCGRPRRPALLAMRGGTARDNSDSALQLVWTKFYFRAACF
jgi:hypothetical protein